MFLSRRGGWRCIVASVSQVRFGVGVCRPKMVSSCVVVITRMTTTVLITGRNRFRTMLCWFLRDNCVEDCVAVLTSSGGGCAG